MYAPGSRRWIKLSFVYRNDAFDLHYEDGLGVKLDPGKSDVRVGPFNTEPDAQRFSIVNMPAGMSASIQSVVASRPNRRSTPRGMQVIPLAVFVVTPQDMHWLDFYVREVLFLDPGIEFELIYFNKFEVVNEFTLPLNIRFYGDDSEEIQKRLRDRSWYSSNANVESFGLSLKSVGAIVPPETDILVIDSENTKLLAANEITGIFSDHDLNLRLIIVTGGWSPDILTLANQGHPVLYAGESLRREDLDFIVEFFYGLIHDFALHEAVYWARKKSPERNPVLFANEITNHGLHLNEAMENYKDQVSHSHQLSTPGTNPNSWRNSRSKKMYSRSLMKLCPMKRHAST